MLNEDNWLTLLGHINPLLAEKMTQVYGYRRFGNPKLLCTLEDIDTVENGLLIALLMRYNRWLSEVYHNWDTYPGDNTQGESIVTFAPRPCGDHSGNVPGGELEIFPQPLPVSFVCADHPDGFVIQVSGAIAGGLYDPTFLEIQTDALLGTTVVDVNNFSILYSPSISEAIQDTMVLKIRDIYGQFYFIPVVISTDCSQAVDCGTLVAAYDYLAIGAPGLPTWSSVLRANPSGGTPPYSYLWTVEAPCTLVANDEETAVVQYDPMDFPIIFKRLWLEVTDANGCQDTVQAFVSYNNTYNCACQDNIDYIEVEEGQTVHFNWVEPSTYHEGIEVASQGAHGVVAITDAMTGQFSYTADSPYSGPDYFYVRWNMGTDFYGSVMYAPCRIDVLVTAAAAPCPEPVLTLIRRFTATTDPEMHIAGVKLILIEIATVYVAALTDFTVRWYRASDGFLIETSDLVGDNWQFDGQYLYGGIDNQNTSQLYRIEIEATNACGTTLLTVFHHHLVNTQPVALDDEVWMSKNDTVLINVLGNDYDVNGHPITLIEVEGNAFSATPPDDQLVLPGIGTFDWVDGQNLQFTPELDFVGDVAFDYTIEDTPIYGPLTAEQATATVTVHVQESCSALPTLGVVLNSGVFGARVLDATGAFDTITNRTVAWYLNLGSGYVLHASVLETESFDEGIEGTIYGIRMVVTDTDTGCVYSDTVLTPANF